MSIFEVFAPQRRASRSQSDLSLSISSRALALVHHEVQEELAR